MVVASDIDMDKVKDECSLHSHVCVMLSVALRFAGNTACSNASFRSTVSLATSSSVVEAALPHFESAHAKEAKDAKDAKPEKRSFKAPLPLSSGMLANALRLHKPLAAPPKSVTQSQALEKEMGNCLFYLMRQSVFTVFPPLISERLRVDAAHRASVARAGRLDFLRLFLFRH